MQCDFTSPYYDYEKGEKGASFECKEEALGTGFCIFHDDKYLQDKNNFSDRKQEVNKKLMDKVTYSIAHNETLFCIGYHLPDIEINKDFTKPAYFLRCRFQGRANFSYSTFSKEVTFYKATFCGKADFSCYILRKSRFQSC